MKRFSCQESWVCSLWVRQLAAGGVKFTFTDVSLVDASGAETMGTVQAVVKTQKTGQIITCSYFLDPNNQYAGQFQGIANTVNADSAEAVLRLLRAKLWRSSGTCQIREKEFIDEAYIFVRHSWIVHSRLGIRNHFGQVHLHGDDCGRCAGYD